jgi:hypothetical protein
VVDLANWLETAKMRSNITQNMLGGALLADVLVRMDNAAKAVAANKAVSSPAPPSPPHTPEPLGPASWAFTVSRGFVVRA